MFIPLGSQLFLLAYIIISELHLHEKKKISTEIERKVALFERIEHYQQHSKWSDYFK